VKVPTPAEPEEDFLILEDDDLFRFSIPSKAATSKKQRQGRTTSIEKDSSTDTGKKDSSLETAPKPQESEQTTHKLGSQTVKTKKGKWGNKKMEAEPESYKQELPPPEDLAAGNLMVEEKLIKKKQRLRKVTSKESDKEEEQPEHGASGETQEEQPTQKTEKKASQSSDVKRPTSLKDGNETAQTSRAKSRKGARKVDHGSDAAKQTMKEQSQSTEEAADAENRGSLPGKDPLLSAYFSLCKTFNLSDSYLQKLMYIFLHVYPALIACKY